MGCYAGKPIENVVYCYEVNFNFPLVNSCKKSVIGFCQIGVLVVLHLFDIVM